jgi:hypothetical protein
MAASSNVQHGNLCSKNASRSRSTQHVVATSRKKRIVRRPVRLRAFGHVFKHAGLLLLALCWQAAVVVTAEDCAAQDVNSGPAKTVEVSIAALVCAVNDAGSVFCMGNNAFGTLGQGDTVHRSTPTLVDLGTGVRAQSVDLFKLTACAVLVGGSVKCWGENTYGQLGLEDSADRGKLAEQMGDTLPTVNLGTGRTAVSVKVGEAHACAILDDGSVKCWGRNQRGQLGYGDVIQRGDGAGEMGDALPAVALGTGRTAVSISAGFEHTCAVLDDQSLKCWGWNGYGGLGYGDITQRGDGAGEMGDALPAVALGTGRTAVSISAGMSGTTCAI